MRKTKKKKNMRKTLEYLTEKVDRRGEKFNIEAGGSCEYLWSGRLVVAMSMSKAHARLLSVLCVAHRPRCCP